MDLDRTVLVEDVRRAVYSGASGMLTVGSTDALVTIVHEMFSGLTRLLDVSSLIRRKELIGDGQTAVFVVEFWVAVHLGAKCILAVTAATARVAVLFERPSRFACVDVALLNFPSLSD